METTTIKRAVCHPNRLIKAKGLCASCYQVQWLHSNPQNERRYKALLKAWKEANPEKVKAINARYYQSHPGETNKNKANFRERCKESAINVYSQGTQACSWCGQADIDVLCLDHIENDGKQHRDLHPKIQLYHWLRNHDYPGGFQVLCMNCNLKKEIMRKRTLAYKRGNRNKPY